jgi:hypothetical protein
MLLTIFSLVYFEAKAAEPSIEASTEQIEASLNKFTQDCQNYKNGTPAILSRAKRDKNRIYYKVFYICETSNRALAITFNNEIQYFNQNINELNGPGKTNEQPSN